MEIVETLLNPFVIVYLAIVVGCQFVMEQWRHRQQCKVAQARRTQGLPPGVIMDHSVKLTELRKGALVEASVFIASILLTPFLLWALTGFHEATGSSLAVVFVGLLIWVAISGTDVLKSFLGGLSFRVLAAFYAPLQVGDRITLKGHSGKVTDIGIFYVILQTLNDDRIAIPTASLWSEDVVNANAGARYSLCVMEFYLDPTISAEKRQQAEQAVWDAIQRSVYVEPAQPMQIYYSQEAYAIRMTAKAYVASTYNEPLFTSDVYREFFDFAGKNDIPLSTCDPV